MFKYPAALFLTLLLIAGSCKKPAPPQQVIIQETLPLVQIGKEAFSLEEYQDSYNKNKFATDSSKALTPEEYISLYTDQKIKVIQAKQEGRDTTTDYKEEIASYKEQLARNFLVDKEMVEKLSEEAYDRLKQEVRASHILVGIAEDADPADTLEAYRATIALKGRLEEGSDFGDLASRFSKDPSAKKSKGDLGYFTAFQNLYPIETAAYTLPVGRVSQPVRTRNGYHLIKVTDRRPNRGMVQVAHIMVQIDTTRADAVKKAAAQSRINEAYAKLQDGDPWEDVVSAYSDDVQSRKNGGILPLFGTGQMVPEIEEASFALNKINSYSKPVWTMYGWHIVKLIEKKDIEPYAVMASTIRKKVVTDSRGRLLEQAATARLRAKYAVQENEEGWNAVSVLVDSTILAGKWDYMRPVSSDWSAVTLFTIEQTPYDALPFLDYLKRKQSAKSKGSAPAVVFRRYYNEYLAEQLSNYEREHLEETNTEFRNLLTEIREGVLASQLMEEHVWQRSLSDSVGQQRVYDLNKDKYQFPERAAGMVIAAKDTQTINVIRKVLALSPYKLERKLPEIIYDNGMSDLKTEHQQTLSDLYIVMQKNPEYIVEIAGYRATDEEEVTSANRIKNVVKFLTSKNISILRIIEKDYGSFRQAAEPERSRRIGFQFYSQSRKDVEKIYNEESPDAVMIQDGYFTMDNPIFKKFKWETGEQIVTGNGRTDWLEITRIDAARVKTFAEARGSVINDYQKQLEKQWLAELQQKFPVKVNVQELEKIKR